MTNLAKVYTDELYRLLKVATREKDFAAVLVYETVIDLTDSFSKGAVTFEWADRLSTALENNALCSDDKERQVYEVALQILGDLRTDS